MFKTLLISNFQDAGYTLCYIVTQMELWYHVFVNRIYWCSIHFLLATSQIWLQTYYR